MLLLFCKARHEPHSGLGDLKISWPAKAGAYGVRRDTERKRGVGLEYLDLPAARLIFWSNEQYSTLPSILQASRRLQASSLVEVHDARTGVSCSSSCVDYGACGGKPAGVWKGIVIVDAHSLRRDV
jgi:hypothetical protein